MNHNKKCEITDIESTDLPGAYRIRALQDIPRYGVKAGDLGGFVQSDYNLSQYGDCWIGDEGLVAFKSQVTNDARVCGFASLYGNATVVDNALVTGNAIISDYAWVGGSTRVYGDALVVDNACLEDNARVFGKALVSGETILRDNVRVGENVKMNSGVFGGDYWYGRPPSDETGKVPEWSSNVHDALSSYDTLGPAGVWYWEGLASFHAPSGTGDVLRALRIPESRVVGRAGDVVRVRISDVIAIWEKRSQILPSPV